MSDEDLLKDIQACLAGMDKEQLKAVEAMFGEDVTEEPEEEQAPKHGLEKTRGFFHCAIVLKCTLCGTEHSTMMISSSHLPSTMETPTCLVCEEVLRNKSAEELITMLIKVSNGAWDAVKEAKNAPVVMDILANWGGNARKPE